MPKAERLLQLAVQAHLARLPQVAESLDRRVAILTHLEVEALLVNNPQRNRKMHSEEAQPSEAVERLELPSKPKPNLKLPACLEVEVMRLVKRVPSDLVVVHSVAVVSSILAK